ncbi:F420-dependent oxidoreductase-like protein [Kineococcus xinjiangensis]|uniref:F420-dependent oxidoreductase-like protein n=1 Tax=Kineococcus xinjiangensis TaxID=512762 RepID=A0A2S6IVB7_9ACTN|nr:LLM class F420-dependent oxidoreductase [Kineococcus xinjiangensis]PPK98222.1 F420-dependent oxidoreductase-like protein [Kineococcus xinjiangensis]
MRLGLSLGYLVGDPRSAAADALALTRRAEELGYDSVHVAEAYGSDAPTLLSWLGGQTSRINLVSAVMQIPGRTPAATAMTAATLDGISGGRFRLGLGVSGPQVSEGWHGTRFDAPLARTREYVDVVRLALARQPLVYQGEHLTLPLPDGSGIPLRLALPAPRPDLPVYLAAVGPRNVALAGEIADGWLPVYFSPEHSAEQLEQLSEGRSRAAARPGAPDFDIAPTVPLVVTDATGAALREAEATVRGHTALYLGGMGSKKTNFYHRLATRMGYGAEADEVQRLFLDKRHREAAGAVPQGFLDATCLVGPQGGLRQRFEAYAAAGVTTLVLAPMSQSLEEKLRSLEAAAKALATV